MSEVLRWARSRAVQTYRRARRHARSRITKAVTVPSRADLPNTLHPHRIYLIGGATAAKWALLDCPCGRGHTIELNLASPARTRWNVTTTNTGEPSVHPSIDHQGVHRCHYWLRAGRVHWVPDRPRRTW